MVELSSCFNTSSKTEVETQLWFAQIEEQQMPQADSKSLHVAIVDLELYMDQVNSILWRAALSPMLSSQ